MTSKEFAKTCKNLLPFLTKERLNNTALDISKRCLNTSKCLQSSFSFQRYTRHTASFKHFSPWKTFSQDSSNHKNTLLALGNVQCNNHSHCTNTTDTTGNDYMEFSDEETKRILSKDMLVKLDFVSEEEESDLFREVEPYLKRMRYESSHWDDAIHGYRETERKVWTEKNKTIIQRVRDAAFPPGTPQIAYVHVLDLQKEGYIKPHVDAVKFCGSTIAGISLLSPCVMRLVHTEDKTKFADILLERRSLYIMKDAARYNYTHEVLPDESIFKGRSIIKDRRISVICRNEP